MKLKQNYIIQLLLVVSMVFRTGESFKLPLKIKKLQRPMREMQLESEEGRSSDINSVLSAPGKTLKYPDESETGDDGVDKNGNENNYFPFYPVVVSFRNGAFHSDSSYIGEGSPETIKYEDARTQLEKFYKHPTKTKSAAEEIIVFPNEDDSLSDTKPNNSDDNHDVMRFGSESQESSAGLFPSSKEVDGSTNNTTSDDDTNKQSLVTLAQIVRHFLTHKTEPDPSSVTENALEAETETLESTTELEVQEQSLYSGPKLKANADSSDECPDGFKKTRNGFCQKPSRRLGNG